MPLLNPFRGTDFARGVVSAINGLAIAVSVIAAHWVCGFTGGDASYAMYALPFVAMVLNDWQRIGQMRVRRSVAGQDISSEPDLRPGMIRSEHMSAVADVVGFGVGISLLPSLRWF
jgi:hypothetical protein